MSQGICLSFFVNLVDLFRVKYPDLSPILQSTIRKTVLG